MIYLFDQLEYITDSFLDKIISLLPLERRQKAQSYKFLADKRQSALGYMLLLYGLKKEYGIFEELEFTYGKRGKPYLKNYPDIHFNISHCKYGVVCAISDKKVGIDIEAVEAFDIELGKHINNMGEMEAILNSKKPEVEFYRLWTKKESLLKLTGEGICTNLRSVLEKNNTVHITTIDSSEIENINPSSEKYIISICTGSEASTLSRKEK